VGLGADGKPLPLAGPMGRSTGGKAGMKPKFRDRNASRRH
jgi:hypothetical protein